LHCSASHGLSVWVYQGADWYVLDERGPRVEYESNVCQCEPSVIKDFDGVETGVTKIVGVSDDFDAVRRRECRRAAPNLASRS
jgi:hypothetical protein